MLPALLGKAPVPFNAKARETAPHFAAICYLSGMEERIVKLETLSAMQDGTIGELNQEIFRQQQDMARLRRRIETIEAKLAAIGDPEEIAGNEKPPHY